jgi:hypothetical protein
MIKYINRFYNYIKTEKKFFFLGCWINGFL